MARSRQEFRVVLDGVELSEEAAERVNAAVQRAAMAALADVDTQGDLRVFLPPWKERFPFGRTVGIMIERIEREQLEAGGFTEPAEFRAAD